MDQIKQNISNSKYDLVSEIIQDFSKLGLRTLKNHHTKLNYLCINFDPYDSMEMSSEIENIITEFKLNEFLSNPFEFTNVVLQILDKLDNEIKARKH